MNSCDYLIIGGGIAGLSVAHYLEKNSQDFRLINLDLEGLATKISSGVINPVTGKRFVLTWNYEELKKIFLSFYQELEVKFFRKFIEESQLVQILKSAEEQNSWLSRTADPIYNSYFGETNVEISDHFHLPVSTSSGIIKSMFVVKIEELIQQLENHYLLQDKYILSQFYFDELLRTNTELIWRDLHIRKAIVFTEGFRINTNPFFNWLPVIPLKGECLQISCPQLNFQSVYKSDYSIVPIKDSKYWCGSNFYLFETDLNKTEEEKQNQIHFLNEVLKNSFEVEKHSFGIRPASRDRRPMIGPHPHDPRLIVFNGLGTKGLSLAPYCAYHLVEWMIRKIPISNEIGLQRLLSKGFSPTPI